MKRTFFTRPALRAAAATALLAALPAMATLVSPISVDLIAPGGYTDGTNTDSTPLTLTQTVDYGVPINVAGGGAIGGFMLANEIIALVGDSVHISAYQGDAAVARTGYLGSGGDHARYELHGLEITGRTITGFTLYAFDNFATSGFSGLVAGTSGVSLTDSDSNGSLDTLVFNLDDLRFLDRGQGSSLNHADFRIDILSTDGGGPPPGVPEPGSLALALAALLSLRGVNASRRRG